MPDLKLPPATVIRERYRAVLPEAEKVFNVRLVEISMITLDRAKRSALGSMSTPIIVALSKYSSQTSMELPAHVSLKNLDLFVARICSKSLIERYIVVMY